MNDHCDLIDEVNCADSCEAVIAMCELIDKQVEDIQYLELECISLRYMLSWYLDEEQGEFLRMDILSNLGRRFHDDPAYELYRNILYNGGDPMEFRDYQVKVRNAREGNWPCWH